METNCLTYPGHSPVYDSDLERWVAIKLADGVGESVFALEHDHVVRIYSERRLADGRRSFLKQWIHGASFEKLGEVIHARQNGQVVDGQFILTTVSKLLVDRIPLAGSRATDRRRVGAFDLDELVTQWAESLGQALRHAHARGVVHGRLHARNILVNFSGKAYLADFAGDLAPLVTHLNRDVDRLKKNLLVFYVRAGGDPRGELAATLRAETFHFRDPAEKFVEEISRFAECRRLSEQFRVPGGRLGRLVEKHPLISLLFFRHLPQLAATLVCGLFCFSRREIPFNPTQKHVLALMVRGYSGLSYLLGFGLVALLSYPILRAPRRPGGEGSAKFRRAIRRLPVTLAAASTFFWLSALVVFPFATYRLVGQIQWRGTLHFGLALITAWLIATGYSTLYTYYFCLHHLYPRFLSPAANLRATMEKELRATRRLLAGLPLALALIPCLAAGLLVWAGPAEFEPARLKLFRMVLILLIAIGGAGFLFSAELVRHWLRRTRID